MSISAPRMQVKSQRPWSLTLLILVLAIALGGAAALWIYDLGRAFAGLNKLSSADAQTYQARIAKLTGERDRYSTTVNSADSQLTIERSAQKQLAAQVKSLEAENNKLKEDLAFFESLLPADTRSQEISIRWFTTEMVTPNQVRYRVLLMQGGRGKTDFSGSLQLAVTTLQAGRTAVILFPLAKSVDADKFKLLFRHYQRVEGTLTIPDGASVKSVQARVIENGQVRAQISASP
jgi:hypothetical protein